jgi:K+-transporting ATPase ATPase B chain
MAAKARPLFDAEIVKPAMIESVKKLNPFNMWKNPVMFVTEVGAALTTLDLVFTKDSRWFGSRWYLQTSPRQWRKGAARRRRTR